MTEYAFSTGTMIGTRTDVTGTAPSFFGVLQDISIDFDQKLESLYGQLKVAAYLGDGALKITGKAKFARIQQTLYANLMFASTLVTNSALALAVAEAHTIPATSTYTVTVTNNALVPLVDQGVFYQSTGVQFTPAASLTATGQYSFNASTGVYTFYSGDAGVAVWIYYTYTATSGYEATNSYANPMMGTSPIFTCVFQQIIPIYGVNKTFCIKLNACKSRKLSLPFSSQKFLIQEFDLEAMQDSSGNVMSITTTE